MPPEFTIGQFQQKKEVKSDTGEQIPKKDSKSGKKSIIDLFSEVKQAKLKTITPDRGQEFILYQEFSKACCIDCFFADPYSLWHRGTNKNTNELLREYLPKGQDFTEVLDSTVDLFVSKLNLRPKKCFPVRFLLRKSSGQCGRLNRQNRLVAQSIHLNSRIIAAPFALSWGDCQSSTST